MTDAGLTDFDYDDSRARLHIERHLVAARPDGTNAGWDRVLNGVDRRL